MKREIIRTFKLHPKADPLPEGAKLISSLDNCHHGRYSNLIELPTDSQTGEKM